MHDFDVDRAAKYEQDRSFKIGGEKFIHRPSVRPELMADWEDISTTTPAREVLAITDALIVAWLDTDADPTGPDRYKALRQRDSDPIGGGDLSALVTWLYRQSTRRPTVPPSPSSDGSGATGTTSTATSSTEQGADSAT